MGEYKLKRSAVPVMMDGIAVRFMSSMKNRKPAGSFVTLLVIGTLVGAAAGMVGGLDPGLSATHATTMNAKANVPHVHACRRLVVHVSDTPPSSGVVELGMVMVSCDREKGK